jgi:hypothetical protein
MVEVSMQPAGGGVLRIFTVTVVGQDPVAPAAIIANTGQT